jgi:hypothetical protein
MVSGSDYAVDFFVSHADVDVQWAEWIAAELENAGYGVIVKACRLRSVVGLRGVGSCCQDSRPAPRAGGQATGTDPRKGG